MANVNFKVKNNLDVLGNSLSLTGSSSGSVTIQAPSAASGTLTLPSSTGIVATQEYVNSLMGINAQSKDPVKAATVTGGNIILSGSAPNILDGVVLALNDRILVKDQTTGSQNGIYYVSVLGTGSNGTWLRATDSDTSAEVKSAIVFIENGNTSAGYTFLATYSDWATFVLDTHSFTWNIFSKPTTNIPITDNNSTAFRINEGSNNYFVVDTTNTTEKIKFGADDLVINRGAGNIVTPTIYGSTAISGNLTLRSTISGTKGKVLIDENTNSSSTITGALVVSGGVGIAGNNYVGGSSVVTGNLTVYGNTQLGDAGGDTLTIHPSSITWSNPVTHSNNHTFSGNLTVNGDVNAITTSTNFFAAPTGSVNLFAGTGAADNINIGGAGSTVVVQNLTVNGTTTTVNSSVVTIDDPIFTIGGDIAPGADDNKDRGIEFRWHNGTTAKVGFFGFDDSTGKFTFIPDATNTSEIFSGTPGIININTVELTTLKAGDGTSAGSIANSTGVVTLASSVLTTADINGGTIDGAVIGGATPAAGSFTTLGATGNVTLGDAAATDAHTVNGALTIKNTSANNTLLIEDDTSPDATPLAVTAAGNLVIGKNSIVDATLSEVFFQMYNNTTSYGPQAGLCNDYDGVGGGYLRFMKRRGGTAPYNPPQIGNAIGNVNGYGWDGVSAFREATRITFRLASAGTISATSMPGVIDVYTTPDGSVTPVQALQINSAQQVGYTDGTVSLPSITNIGDVNTGLYFPAEDEVAIGTGGTHRVRVGSTGDVSIGPSSSLTGFRLALWGNTSGVSSSQNIMCYAGPTYLSSLGTYTTACFSTFPSTEAATFTLPSMFHFRASQGTLGAGSTVTDQVGFEASASLIGATTNYGFRTVNAAAVTSGKTHYSFYAGNNTATGGGTTWNFFAGGTAANYFAGNVGIGTSTFVAASKLEISGANSTNYLTINNTTASDAADYRWSVVRFRGTQSGGETSTLAQIVARHDGAADDEKGNLSFCTNDGNDGEAPAERLRITSGGHVGLNTSDPTFGYPWSMYGRVIGVVGDATGTASAYGVFSAANNRATPTVGDHLGYFSWSSVNNPRPLKAYIGAFLTGSGGTDGFGGEIRFYTHADNAATDASVEHLRIDNTGNLTLTSGKSLINYGAGGVTTNSSIGSGALQANTTGNYNTANGVSALLSNTTGYSNTANGVSALQDNTTGTHNTASGVHALLSNTTGYYNTANGFRALLSNTTGTNNTASGMNALQSNTTGAGNICVGSHNSSGTYAPVFDCTTENDRVVIGSTAVTNAYIQVAWTVVSDARDKTNFAAVPHGLDFVQQLNPIAYQFKASREDATPHGPVRYGFKAQDILALEGDSPVIIDNENEDKLRYNGEALVPVLVNAIKELSAKLDAMQSEINQLKGL